VADPAAGISADPIKFDEAIAAIRRRVPMTEEIWTELEEQELEFAFTVADVAQLDLVVDVYEAIGRAVESGTTLEDFKAEVQDSLESAWGEEDAGRVETIFRTNVQGAYNAGRHEAAQAVKEDRPYWRYQAILDNRTSDVCSECDGTLLEADSSWWQSHYPPLHPNCRCIAVTMTQEEAEDEGVSDGGPSAKPVEGFGQAPSGGGGDGEDVGGGRDWEPDPDDYPDDLAAELEDKMAEE
jgi:SPP1 gp7 family putative phage head morphogenesis protein